MNREKLSLINDELKINFKDYLSMIATGSIVVGDPYIKGRSDKDIVLIFKNNPIKYARKIESIVKKFDFDDSYLFTPIPKNNWGLPNSKYSFSNKFRSKTLFGKDFVELSVLPTMEKIKLNYSKGLQGVIHKIYNGLINSGSWTVEDTRDKFWKQFKHAFMYLAIREYYFSGDYPRTRKDVADKLKSAEVKNMFDVLHSIDERSKDEIIKCSRDLVSYLEKI